MTDEQAGSQRAADYAPVEVDFSPDPGFQLLFDGMHAEEELGRPFLINLDLSSGTLRTNVSTLIGSACCVWLYQAEDQSQDQAQDQHQAQDQAEPDRYFHGFVTRIRSAGLSGGAYRYKLELRPWIWLLSQTADCRIFQKKSAFQIITQIFRDAGFSDFEDHRQSGAGDIELEYCVQYRETSLAFVTRLMELFGLYYYFKFSRTAHTLVIADDPNSHALVAREVPYQFDQTEYRAVSPHVWEWSADLGLLSGQYTLRDYNFTTPSADLTAKTRHEGQHQHGDLDVYDYPGPYDTAQHGHRLSDVRMQSISRQRVVYAGQSNSRKLRAGWRFKLSNYPDRAVNGEYLICRSVTTVSSAEGTPNPQAETVDTYRVELTSIKGDVPYRLLNLTPRPMIRGPQTAKVVGESGEEITTDKYGRIKVQFHWDRSDTPEDQRSCWIRVAQTWAGGSWGSMFIPRVGQEVVVEFLEGNPDRPLITGVVYNANNQVPHTLPDNKTQSTIKSSSSPGGNGFNEFRFEDKGGSEEIYMHAERDWKREIGHDETAEIKNDRTAKIMQGNDSVSVLAGKSDVTAAQSITLTVGANSIKIDQSGITINGVQVQVQSSATMSLTAGASLSLTGATIALN